MKPLAEQIRDLLASRIGPANAITAPQIAVELQAPEREIRKVIARNFRVWAFFLVCMPGLGFYVADDAEQVRRRYMMLARLASEAKKKAGEFALHAQSHGFGGIINQ